MFIVISCFVPSQWEGCTEALYLQPKTSQWLKGSILGISISAPWNCCSRGKCWDGGGQALQHQSHWWLKSWACKTVICIIFLSEAITAILAFSDGRPIVLFPLRNYYQMEGVNHKRNSCIKADEASCYGNFRECLLLWPGCKSCLIQIQWQLGKTSTDSLAQIFSCLTGLFCGRHYPFPEDWCSICFSMCDNPF